MRTIASRATPQTNKVMQQTFLMLAISLIPTAIGSWVGSAMNLTAAMAASPWMYLIGFLIAAFGLMFMIMLNKDNVLGIFFLLTFTGLMGFLLSTSLDAVMSLRNGPHIITLASLTTVGICIGAFFIGYTSSYDFSKLGNILLYALLAVIAISVLNMVFFKLPGLHLAIAFVSVAIFTVYLIYDVQAVVSGGETNYIMATLQIYLDIFNIFVNLLQIFASLSGGDDD